MSNFLSLDSPIIQFLNKVCDLLFLSVVYTICCIPIITIGPATTALYYATVKVIRRERGYLMREFFHSFKTNFKSGSFVTIILLLAYGILYVDREYAQALSETSGKMGFAMSCIFNAMFLIVVLVTLYVFPVLSRFTVKGLQLLKTSFFMSIRHLPSTILVAVVVGGTLFILRVIPMLFFILPGVAALLSSFMIERVFRKYMPAPNENAEEEGTDEWYWE